MFRCGTYNPTAQWTSPIFRSARLGVNRGGPEKGVHAKLKSLAAIALHMACNGLPMKDAPRRTGGFAMG
jgi:hypothetical protein